MSRDGAGRAGRPTRWWRLDRNPLRRTVDRVEAVIVAALCVMFLAGAPWVALAAGRWAAATGIRAERAQAQWRQVRAVLRGAAAGAAHARSQGGADPLAPARWTAPDGTARTGDVYAPAGARAGNSVVIWVNGRGQPTAAPLQPADVADRAALAALLACLLSAGALAAAAIATRLVANRRRLARWDLGWSVAGPQWTGRR